MFPTSRFQLRPHLFDGYSVCDRGRARGCCGNKSMATQSRFGGVTLNCLLCGDHYFLHVRAQYIWRFYRIALSENEAVIRLLALIHARNLSSLAVDVGGWHFYVRVTFCERRFVKWIADVVFPLRRAHHHNKFSYNNTIRCIQLLLVQNAASSEFSNFTTELWFKFSLTILTIVLLHIVMMYM